jgi:hypothetical protein
MRKQAIRFSKLFLAATKRCQACKAGKKQEN